MTAPAFDALDRPPHLLIVDDDDRIRELLKRYLAQAGARVSTAADAASAKRLLSTLDFDLLILDVMMPVEDGFSLAEAVRKTSNVPIILLTARGMPEDRIRGLQIGADDYVPKPFEPAELALRINAILRRTIANRGEPPEVSPSAPFSFNAARGELTRDTQPVRLTEAEVSLLRVLAARPRRCRQPRRPRQAHRRRARALSRCASHAPPPQDRNRPARADLPANRARRRLQIGSGLMRATNLALALLLAAPTVDWAFLRSPTRSTP